MVNGCSSLPTVVSSGVPQGSVLGPLLFLLYINDLPQAIDCQKTSVRLFADDAILYRPVNHVADCHILQQQLLQVADWAEEWQLQFNVNKCTSTSMHPAALHHSYQIDSIPLAHTDCFTYLGVRVLNTLSFSVHIAHTLQKANSTLYMLMRALKNASSASKRTSYFSICLPLLEYASEVWSPSLAYHIADFEKINRKAFRWAYSFKKFDSISSQMEKAKWHTLAIRRAQKDQKTLHKILTDQLKVDHQLFTQTNTAYNTRNGNIRHTINSQAMKFSFFNRTMNFV